jgi:hypothetical protein
MLHTQRSIADQDNFPAAALHGLERLDSLGFKASAVVQDTIKTDNNRIKRLNDL